MKAKFVYESIEDVLKPKSKEEIWSSIENSDLSPNILLYKSAETGFLSGVKKALKNGAYVHVNNDQALRMASLYGQYNVVALLLDNGANVHAKNDWALRWASYYDHTDVVELLKKMDGKG